MIINRLSNRPMFFALSYEHAKEGWLKNILDEGNQGYIYEYTYDDATTNIYDTNNVKVKKLAKLYSIDIDDYINDILCNPSMYDINRNDFTKALLENGIDGLKYSDYDPRDFLKDLDAIIIFRPLSHKISFKLIKENISNNISNVLINDDVEEGYNINKFIKYFKTKYKSFYDRNNLYISDDYGSMTLYIGDKTYRNAISLDQTFDLASKSIIDFVNQHKLLESLIYSISKGIKYVLK